MTDTDEDTSSRDGSGETEEEEDIFVPIDEIVQPLDVDVIDSEISYGFVLSPSDSERRGAPVP